MYKVILVPTGIEGSYPGEIQAPLFVPSTDKEPVELVFATGISAAELANLIQPGSRVIAHRFNRNSDGLIIGEESVGVMCERGLDAILKSELSSDCEDIFETVSSLSKRIQTLVNEQPA